MNAAAQTLAYIKPGIPVVLNCGLGSPAWHPQCRHSWANMQPYHNALRELLESGYRGVVINSDGPDEAVLVTTGVFKDGADLSTFLYEAVDCIAQDCIAIYYPSLKEGYLLGPYADRWGTFNINLFKLPEDSSC